jgi:uncharacterized repeat protein (TIGR03803 family)
VKLRRQSRRAVLTLAALLAVILLKGTANAADTYRVIYDFGHSSSDGWLPVGVPAVARNGDLLGVTYAGGPYNLGTVYKLSAPRTRGGAWTETILYGFPGGNGGMYPLFLLIGKDGDLYGASGETIFELSPPTSSDGAWSYTALYTLNQQNDGVGIEGLVFDAEANLYGATELGGDLGCDRNGGCGTVFELKRPIKGGRKWHFRVLHTFTGTPDGAEPFAGVTFDQKGNLYGTTNYDGTYGYGVVYRVSPPKQKGGSWTETVLYSFDRVGDIGADSGGPVTFDGSGNLYGTTGAGGDLNCQGGFGCGVVFELLPPVQKGGAWTYATLYAFQGGNDGIDPSGYMVFDNQGNLYGTTQVGGGATEGGTVYRLKPPTHKGSAWTETVLHGFIFGSGDGAVPDGLTWGKWNYLYGVTGEGGLCLGCGTAFELQP